MSSKIQMHMLRSLPFSNPNRDETGRPKVGVFGGVPRLRLSSQSLKRAIRDSDTFLATMGGNRESFRTRTTPARVAEALADRVEPELLAVALPIVIGAFTDVSAKGAKQSAEDYLASIKSKTLAFFHETEVQRMIELVEAVATSEIRYTSVDKKTGKQGPNFVAKGDTFESKMPKDGAARSAMQEDWINRVIMHENTGIELALFGRMLAQIDTTLGCNIDGAVQVAHAFTTHRAAPEDDLFTGLDDLDPNGAGMMGNQQFGSGVYYSYASIDVEMLRARLNDDAEVERAIRAFVTAFHQTLPGGKKTSFAHNVLPFYARVEVGSGVNRSLGDAFTAPVQGENIPQASIEQIEDYAERLDRAYGYASVAKTMDVYAPSTASFAELVDHAASAAK